MARLTHYDDQQVANALAMLRANGNNMLKTSELTGIPRSTLRSWAGQLEYAPRVIDPSQVQDKSVELSDMLQDIAFKAVGDGMAEAILKANARDRMIVAGIAIEKRQLLIGGPTSRNASVVIHLAGTASLNELAERTLSGTEQPPELPAPYVDVTGDDKAK